MDTKSTSTNLTVIEQRLETIDRRLEDHDRRFDDHDRRFDDHDRRFDDHDRRFDDHDRRFDGLDRRLDDLTTDFREFRILQEEQATKLDKVLDVVLHINDRLAKHDNLVAKVEDHDHRIFALEGTVGRSS